MEILENREAWQAHFEANWLAHYTETGTTNFKLYEYTRNSEAVSGKAIDLSQSKLLFVTSAGAYLKDSQSAYDAENDLGDYTIRLIPQSSELDKLAFAHTHYNHQYVDQDTQSLVPLRLLEQLQAEGVIGELADDIVSFHGYTPDAGRVVDEVIPQIIGIAKEQQVDAAILIPVWPLCTQAVSLLNRAFEIEGIPSVMTASRDGIPRRIKAPRTTFTTLPRGASIGAPHDTAQQRRVLEATLDLFKQEAPIKPVVLDETLAESS